MKIKQTAFSILALTIVLNLAAQHRVPVPDRLKNIAVERSFNPVVLLNESRMQLRQQFAVGGEQLAVDSQQSADGSQEKGNETWNMKNGTWNMKNEKWNMKNETRDNEFTLGTTYYDLQSKLSSQNRIFFYPDGRIAAVWTMGMEEPSFPDIGTAYNYYDGTEWNPEPAQRIESEQAKFPSYAPVDKDGEIIVSQGMNNLIINKRMHKGSGSWEESMYYGPGEHEDLQCPKIISNGLYDRNIHILAVTNDINNGGTSYHGQNGALLYSRSYDGGNNFEISNSIFDELDSNFYKRIPQDGYNWAEPVGNTLAFVVGDPWMDLVLMKSDDNGDSWNKTVIWEHPYPFFDFNTTITDTFYCNDGSIAVALDIEKKAHITFAISRVLHDSAGPDFTIFPFTDGIVYWNETMEIFSNDINALDPEGEELILDYNLIGFVPDVDMNGTIDLLDVATYPTFGLSTMPTIVTGRKNEIFIAFCTPTETLSWDTTYTLRHIWGRHFLNGYWEWPEHLTDDFTHIFYECIYPVLSPNRSHLYHLQCQGDWNAGLASLSPPYHSYQENRIIYKGYEPFYMFMEECDSYFLAEHTTILKGDSLDFYSYSQVGSSWNWKFGGGSPTFSNFMNPVNIIYDMPGKYETRFNIFCAGYGIDTTLREDYIEVVTPANIADADMTNEQLTIYPNPGTGIFNIKSNFIIQNIQVFNSLGIIVYEDNYNNSSSPSNLEINFGVLSKGIYFLKIKNKNKIVSKKLIIK